ncbi:HTH-type transcriptional regulator PgrR [Andreprevotia sp. IGB-42]|uniref:LysR family transcriptional regulator n=1 Tax=Andreprevotia sp. IGB-42 TaxID=2497473 RepID=UPI001356968B|nr:LysR family transcriptional regulator [Andreprevotia sp. IGB-42]KAF0812840.1 HTH-type transcriptional regulator PgrR [Andreprevotia sp. IGB-42]
MTDRLSGIAAFVEAVDAGSFALAAERLNLSRSAVGKSIARLESRLGTRLFQRTTRSQRLTEDGNAYYTHCVRALAELEAAEAALDDGQREPAGRLRISMPVLFGRRCVTPILLTLAQRYPQLTLEVLYSDQRVNLVEDGIDLAIRSGELADSAGLTARKVGAQFMVVCGNADYLARHGRPHTLTDLAQHTSVSYTRAGLVVPWRFNTPDKGQVEVKTASRINLNDIEAIRDAGLAGMGLVWMPRWLIRGELQSGQLIPLFEELPDFSIPMHAVWPQNRHLPSRMRVLIDALVAALPAALSRDAG